MNLISRTLAAAAFGAVTLMVGGCAVVPVGPPVAVGVYAAPRYAYRPYYAPRAYYGRPYYGRRY